MAATQYVGAHYVPHGWEEWNPNTYYDGLFCVSYNYSWFIAKQNVPVGISPVNTEYWAPYSLTTGAQQELVDLVKRYDPTEQLPPGTDFNTLTTPGNYILQTTDVTRYVNEPPNPGNRNGQLHVEYQSFPLGNVAQEVQYPGTGGSGYMTWRRIQAGTDRHWEPWVNTVNSNLVPWYPEGHIGNGGDLNTITKFGNYILLGSNGYQNSVPLNGHNAILEVVHVNDNKSLIIQKLTIFGELATYIRERDTDGSWSRWDYIIGKYSNSYQYIGPFNGNFNDVNIPHGIYAINAANTVTNGPAGISYCVFVQFNVFNTQLIIDSQKIYQRHLTGNPAVWGSWYAFGQRA